LAQVALAGALVASIVGATSLSRPVYATRAPLAAQIVEHAYIDTSVAALSRALWTKAASPDSMTVAQAAVAPSGDSAQAAKTTGPQSRTPWTSAPTKVALQSPAFFHDRESFAKDLVRTGRVSPDRAQSLADVAVREAYTRKIPPALVLGVMMTENDAFKSTARSNVGAVGLMQVMPRIWTSVLGQKFGTNLRADSTNLKYGIWILGWLTEKTTRIVEDADDAWRHMLLRYNGCVSGSNTPSCHKYPDVVRRHVVQSARTICGDQTFDECVAKPMWASRQSGGGDDADQSR
jgi:soluble lytic murein transglycosylase-like protein